MLITGICDAEVVTLAVVTAGGADANSADVETPAQVPVEVGEVESVIVFAVVVAVVSTALDALVVRPGVTGAYVEPVSS